jgi:hypothetical protein
MYRCEMRGGRMGKISRVYGMVFSEVVVVFAIILILVISFLPAFVMVVKRFDLIPQMSNEMNASAEEQIDNLYLISRTNTLPNALVKLSASYTVDTEGDKSILSKENGNLKTTIIIVKNSPASGMAKIQINVTRIDNPDPSRKSQIKTILFFK